MGAGRNTVAVVCALGAALIAGDAHGQTREIELGRDAFETASFEAAQALFQHALEDPAATRETLAEAYRYLGALRDAMGDPAGAEEYAAASLAIEPAGAPPDIASPGFDARFEQVRASRRGDRARIDVALSGPLTAHRAFSVRVSTAGIARRLRARVVVHCRSGGAQVGALDAPGRGAAESFDVAIEPLLYRATLECTASLVTRSGALIDRAIARAIVSIAAVDLRLAPDRPRRGPPALLIGGLGLGAAAAVAIATGVAVALAQPSQAVIGAVRIEP